MLKELITHAVAALIGVGIAQLIFFACPERNPEPTESEVITVDTVRAVAPFSRELLKVRFEPVKLPLVRQVAAIAETATIAEGDGSDSTSGCDGSRPCNEGDSVIVSVPIETRVFSDDSTYRAVVSGFRASLDTIDIYNRTIERTVTVAPTKRPRRWGLSVGVGAVATPSGRIEPGVFAGVSYQFVSF